MLHRQQLLVISLTIADNALCSFVFEMLEVGPPLGPSITQVAPMIFAKSSPFGRLTRWAAFFVVISRPYTYILSILS